MQAQTTPFASRSSWLVVFALIAVTTTRCFGQISTDEAKLRMEERARARAAAAQPTTPAMPPPPVAAFAPRLPASVTGVYPQLSDSCLVDGRRVAPARDRRALIDAATGDDERVRKMAVLRLGFELFADEFNRGESGTADADAEKIRDEFGRVLARAMIQDARGEKSAFRSTVDDLTGPKGLVTNLSNQKARDACATIVDYYTLKLMQQQMATQLDADPVADGVVTEKTVPTAFKLAGPDGRIVFTNSTRRTLHNVVLMTHFRPDVDACVRGQRDKSEHDAPAYVIQRAMGFSEESIRAQQQAEAAQWALEATDKGTLIYLPTWSAGSKVEAAFAPTDSIVHSAQSADASAWADEGQVTDRPLDLADMSKRIVASWKARTRR